MRKATIIGLWIALCSLSAHAQTLAENARVLGNELGTEELTVKQLFYNFLLSCLNDYTRFLAPPQAKQSPCFDVFDFDGYLKWQEELHPFTNIDFIKQLVHTQAFNQFIESSDHC